MIACCIANVLLTIHFLITLVLDPVHTIFGGAQRVGGLKGYITRYNSPSSQNKVKHYVIE